MIILIASALIIAVTLIAALALSRAAKHADYLGDTETVRWSFRTVNRDGSPNPINWRRIRREAALARPAGLVPQLCTVITRRYQFAELADWTRFCLGEFGEHTRGRWELAPRWRNYVGRVYVEVTYVETKR